MADIGKMALVVTANAAGLDKDLDKAEKRIGSFAKTAEKQTAGGGLTGLLTGLTAGAVFAAVNVAVAGLGKMLAMIPKLKQEAAALGVVFSAKVTGGIDSVSASMTRAQAATMRTFGEVVAAAAPAINTLAEAMTDLLSDISPVTFLINKIAVTMSLSWQTVAGFIKIVAKQVGALWEAFSGSSAVTTWFENWPSWELLVMQALHNFAQGFAGIWDTIKLGAGAAMQQVGRLAFEVGKVVSKVNEKWGAGIQQAGKAAMMTGAQMQLSFGDTRKAVDKLFLDMSKNLAATERKAAELKYSPVGAMLQGSAEAFSVKARFEFGAQMNQQDKNAKDQLAELKGIRAEAKRQADAVAKAGKVMFEVF